MGWQLAATTFGCRFGVWRVPATRVHAAEVRCAAPEAAYAGAADVLSLDFSEAWLMTRGAELRAPDHPLVPMPPFVVPQVYIPPEEKKLTALRITAEPAAHTRAGEPFAGALTAELLDQFGERFLTGDPNGNPHRVRLAMVRTHNATLPPAARLVAPCAVAAVPCTAPRALVALADGGIVTFGDLILNELGGGARFELTLGDLAPVVTESVYSVSLGPAAKLRFIQMPTEDNLQDVHFDSQPIVEVTDLGGNRVAAGTHVISVDLAAGDGRLRGPRTRHSRHGVANFDRLKILLPGYDKVIKATAAGVAAGYTHQFGVIPHGIPHSIRFVSQPPPAVPLGRHRRRRAARPLARRRSRLLRHGGGLPS